MIFFRSERERTLWAVNGLLAFAAGLFGLLGWHGDLPVLRQVLAEYRPISYASCLSLLTLGVTFLASVITARRLAIGLSLLVIGFNLLLLVPGFESTFRDQLSTLSPPLGGSDPTSNLAALLVILLAAIPLVRGYWPHSVFTILLLILSSGTSLIGLIFPMLANGDIRQEAEGPLPLSLLLVAISTSIVGAWGLSLRMRRESLPSIRVLASILVFLSMLTTLGLWIAISADQKARFNRLIMTEADTLMQEIRLGFRRMMERFNALPKEWWRSEATFEKRSEDVGGHLGTNRGAISSGWIDEKGKVRWMVAAPRYGDFRTESAQEWADRIAEFVETARLETDWSISQVYFDPITKLHYLLAFFPSPEGEGRGLITLFSTEEMILALCDEQRRDAFTIEVRSGSTLLTRPAPLTELLPDLEPQAFVFLPTSKDRWTIRLWPRKVLGEREQSSIAFLILMAGLAMSGFLGLTSYLFLKSRDQARRVAQSDARSQALIGNLQQAVFLKDAELRYVAVNRVFCDQLQKHEPEILGRTDEELFPTEPARSRSGEDSTVLLEGVSQEREETVLIDGRPRILQVMRSPVRDARGKVSGLLGVCWDVTEQRQLETQLRQSQKMDALGKLAGGTAHDFNNLLTVMIGNLYLLRDDQLHRDDSTSLIQEAEKAANRAAELVRQLLSFSRQTPIRFEAVAMSTLLQEVVRLVRRTIDAKIQIDLEAGPELWTIQGDLGQLHQVLMNLCINARDAMPQGGLLQISARNVTLTSTQVQGHFDARPGEFVQLTVRDNGKGMTPEVRSRIFEPFFTTKGVGEGTGLGLAQVFGIAQQHNGWVECRTSLGIGTQFDLFFPRSLVEENSVAVVAPISQVAGSETILVIDDEAMIRTLVKRIFETAGYRVLTAESGQMGIDCFRDDPTISLIVLDLNMPEMSGQETFRELLRIDPSVRVIISSGYSEEHLDPHELNLVAAFLAKPFCRDQLLRLVRDVLDQSVSVTPQDAPHQRERLSKEEYQTSRVP